MCTCVCVEADTEDGKMLLPLIEYGDNKLAGRSSEDRCAVAPCSGAEKWSFDGFLIDAGDGGRSLLIPVLAFYPRMAHVVVRCTFA